MLFQLVLGEFIGSFVLILLGNGISAGVTLSKTKATDAGWIASSIGWGLAVVMAIYISGYLSPAHLNPAITIAMAVIGKFSWAYVLPFILAQFAGMMLASAALWFFFYPHWAETDDPEKILGVFATGPSIRHNASNFFGEILTTMVLIAGTLSFTRHAIPSAQAPVLAGSLVSAIVFSLGSTTGAAMNPARDLGPRLMHSLLPIANKGKSNWSYAWIPLFGPLIGAVLGALLFHNITQIGK